MPQLYSPALPPEVVDLIVKDDTLTDSDLQNISLVAPVWKEPSQRRLFSSLRLNPGECHPLYDLAPEERTQFIGYIKHLTLASPVRPGVYNPFPDEEEDIPVPEDNGEEFYSEFSEVKLGATLSFMATDPDSSPVPHIKFPAFLHQITKLKSLTVRDRLVWHQLPQACIKAFIHILGLDSFRSLNICRESGGRFPWIFLHFCSNLKYLALGVCPTESLKVAEMDDSDLVALTTKTTIYPEVLRIIDHNNVDRVKHHITSSSTFGNTISLERIRALYIAYQPCHLSQSNGPTEKIGEFLLPFGASLEEFTLEAQFPDEKTHQLATLETPFSITQYSIPQKYQTSLTNLRKLKFIIHCPPRSTFHLKEITDFLVPFLENLPCPEQLTTFELYHSCNAVISQDTLDRLGSHENRLQDLFELLYRRFTHLRGVKVRIKLGALVSLGRSYSPSDIFQPLDYPGLEKLKKNGVRTITEYSYYHPTDYFIM